VWRYNRPEQLTGKGSPKMASFDSSGVEISYVVEGRGPPIVLVHGFASNLQGNWRATGVIESLMNAG
jgi:pimeloyl-ACP methyl ester carboxylesterase